MNNINSNSIDTYGAQNNYSSENTPTINKTLGKDEFLKLLVTQLKYQNPMEPMKDQDFIAQMANFSALEQMQNLNKSFDSLTSLISQEILPALTMQQASSVIGKEIIYFSSQENEEEIKLLKGVVESIRFFEGELFYYVNGTSIDKSALVSIANVDNSLLKEIKVELESLKNLLTEKGEENG